VTLRNDGKGLSSTRYDTKYVPYEYHDDVTGLVIIASTPYQVVDACAGDTKEVQVLEELDGRGGN